MSNDETFFVVEKILGHRITSDGRDEYQVKWQGYDDPKDLTWEPIANLVSLRAEIDYY
jgi:chromobox protein 1